MESTHLYNDTHTQKVPLGTFLAGRLTKLFACWEQLRLTKIFACWEQLLCLRTSPSESFCKCSCLLGLGISIPHSSFKYMALACYRGILWESPMSANIHRPLREKKASLVFAKYFGKKKKYMSWKLLERFFFLIKDKTAKRGP